MSALIWQLPPLSKVYEAFGTLGDQTRLILLPLDSKAPDRISARVFSSSGQKSYLVEICDTEIICNDNLSFFHHQLGYPALAVLMQLGYLPRDLYAEKALAHIAWKEINQAHKNNFSAALDEILATKAGAGWDITRIQKAAEQTYQVLQTQTWHYPAKLPPPPKGW